MAELYIPPSARESAQAPSDDDLPYDLGEPEEQEEKITILSKFLVVLDADGNASVIGDPEAFDRYEAVKEITSGEVSRACRQICDELLVQRITENVVLNTIHAQQQLARVAAEQKANAQVAAALSKQGGPKGPQQRRR